MSASIIDSLLTQLGVYSVLTVVVVAGGRWVAAKWLVSTIEARINEGVNRRLASLKLDLDKELEAYRSALNREADHLRAALDRASADYGIWAKERHRATAQLFGEFLRLEVMATSFADIAFPPAAEATADELREFLQRAKASAGKVEEIIQAFQSGRHDYVESEVDRCVTEIRKHRVMTARNEAYEAYYKAALYLTAAVDQAALAVRDQFHALVIPYQVVDAESGVKAYKVRQELRFRMLELQNCARDDLAKGTRLSAAPAG